MTHTVELNDKAFKALSRLSIDIGCSKSEVIEILTCEKEPKPATNQIALLITNKSAQIFMAEDTDSIYLECAKFGFYSLHIYESGDKSPINILNSMSIECGVNLIDSETGMGISLYDANIPSTFQSVVIDSDHDTGKSKDLEWVLVN